MHCYYPPTRALHAAEYTGADNMEDIKQYVGDMFRDVHETVCNSEEQQFSVHTTSAVDTGHMRKIFGLVGDMVLSSSLSASGF